MFTFVYIAVTICCVMFYSSYFSMKIDVIGSDYSNYRQIATHDNVSCSENIVEEKKPENATKYSPEGYIFGQNYELMGRFLLSKFL